MTSESISKINHLLRVWPVGTVAISSWLENQGIYQQLAYSYEHSGWLKKVGRGAFARWSDSLTWPGGVYALQKQLKIPVHVGGRTALELQGYAHFLPLGQGGPVYLFGVPGHALPSWFKNFNWGHRVEFKVPQLFKDKAKLGLTTHSFGNFEVQVSSPERAVMELLHLLPAEQDFEEAVSLMEGLRTLRPKLVQELLEKCRSIKVKRIFLALAERGKHAWMKRIDLSKIMLGSGKRRVAIGGVLDPKYQVTLPKPEITATVEAEA